MQCFACAGQGYITCPTCNGQGSYWKVVGLENVWEPCYECGGRREVLCQTCRGTGVLPMAQTTETRAPKPSPAKKGAPKPSATKKGAPKPSATKKRAPKPSAAKKRAALPLDPELLKLTGLWKGGMGRYELVRNKEGYRVTMFNILGWKIGTGQATISGSTLALTVRTLGVTNTADLHLKGGKLHGVMRTLGGLPLPLSLRRA